MRAVIVAGTPPCPRHPRASIGEERLDAQARANQETRSGFLQRLSERELERADARMHDDVERLLSEINIEAPPDDPAKGDIAQMIREDRESH